MLRPPAGASYDARLFRAGEGPVVVYEPEIKSTGLELRASGLWADHVCEERDQRWSVGLEAFGIVVEPGEEVSPESRGERVPVGLDLEWDRSGPLEAGPSGQTMPCTVQGEVLIGVDRLIVDGPGTVSHAWENGSPPK